MTGLTALTVGRTYEWRGPSGVERMGRLLAIGPTGIHQWQNGRLTLADEHFVEVRRFQSKEGPMNNWSLEIFAAVLAGFLVVALCIALTLITVYALDRAAFDKTLDEMKAKAVTLADREPSE